MTVNAKAAYRPEVDGLRTIAVVPVVLFHAGVSVFSGGYVGVDVFFVISGYLITGIILREIEGDGFSIVRFYQRRAKRILPALFTVMLCCIPFAWFWLLPDHFAKFAKSIAAVCLFVSNMWFWREEGYFSTASELKPLIHTWSLAVEEQYYLLFPPVFVLLMRLGRRRALIGLCVAALASFALCEVAAIRAPTANFFLAPTRAWELLVGSICAFFADQPQDSKRSAASWLGLGMILYAIFAFDDDVPFPSHFALLPVIGAALVLLFARTGGGAGRLLAMPPFVGIGLISYSVYLWHQPLLAFARLRDVHTPGLPLMVGLGLLSFPLAWLSWYFIERPFRVHRYTPALTRRAVALAVLALAVFGAVAMYGIATDSVRWRLQENRDPAILQLSATQKLRVLPGPTCPPGFGDDAAPCLILPPPPGGKTIGLFGDSLAEATLPGFLDAAREARVGLVFGFASGCPPFPGIYVYDGNYAPELCARRADEEIAAAQRFKVDTVYLVGRWTLYNEALDTSRYHYFLTREKAPNFPSIEESRAVFAEALPRTVALYRGMGTRVVLVRQLPQFDIDIARYVDGLRYAAATGAQLPALTQAHSKSRAEYEAFSARANAVLAAQQRQGVRVADLSAPFARDDRFVWSDGRTTWYYDFAHVSLAGAKLLAPSIRDMIAIDQNARTSAAGTAKPESGQR